jgi:hypothetical protein
MVEQDTRKNRPNGGPELPRNRFDHQAGIDQATDEYGALKGPHDRDRHGKTGKVLEGHGEPTFVPSSLTSGSPVANLWHS